MAIEAMGAVSGASAAGGGRAVSLMPQGEAGGGADKFAEAIARVGQAQGGVTGASSPALDGFANILDRVDMQAQSVSDYAKTAEASGGTLTPGEIVNLTMRCQEFMFQCQLTSNIANRSSDGVQQLFRQQG